MQERAFRRIRGEAARLANRDRAVAAGERRVREEEEAVAREPTGSSRIQKGTAPPPMWRGGRRQGKGPGRWTRRQGRKEGSGTGGRSVGKGRRRGHRGRPAPVLAAAAGAEETRDHRGVDGGGRGGAGPLREVGGEDEGKAGEEGAPSLQ